MLGVIPAYILNKIEQGTGKSCSDMFDLIAGTSTGGIIAIGLSKPDPFSARDAMELYLQHGPAIFKKRWLFPLVNKYDPKALASILRDKLGTDPFSKCSTPCLVPAYDLRNRRLQIFKSWRNAEPRNDWPLWEVGLATSSAPTYFRAHSGMWDGGVGANCPAMCAFVEARRLWPNERIRVVSMGTGTSASAIDPDGRSTRRPINFAVHQLLHVFMDAQMDAPHYQLKHLLRGRYVRVQGPFEAASDKMDDASAAQRRALLVDARSIMYQNRRAIARLIEELKQ
jgi:hypothetical protein